MNGHLGIIFLHHDVGAITRNNLSSIKRHNPDAAIITMSAGQPFPGGYTLSQTPLLNELHGVSPSRSSDVLLCSWFAQRRECCDKWWIVEWDTYCTTSAKSHYKPVWDFHFIASAVCRTNRDIEWHWFKHVQEMPMMYQNFAVGAVPFLYLISEEALSATCQLMLKNPIVAGNGELRFPTLASACGFGPCAYSPPNDQITWLRTQPNMDQQAIYHSVKHYVGSGTSASLNAHFKIE